MKENSSSASDPVFVFRLHPLGSDIKRHERRLMFDCTWAFAFAVFGCLCGVVLLSPALLAQQSPSRPWYERVMVGMEVGPTGAQFGHSDPADSRYCANWDGAEIVRQCVRANAEYLVLWLRDGDYAYYDSQLLTKAPGLGKRDPLREAMTEARKHDLPIISYCVVQQGGNYLQQNPQWQMRDSDGKPIGRFCFNSGYLDAMKQIAAEQLAYGIDGFHIDMLDQGFGKPYGCWCETCRAFFRDRYQHEMPQGATWDASWAEMLEFRYATSERFEKELTAHIKSLNPQASVDYNYHGNPPFSFEVGQRPVQHAGNGDFVTGETGVWGFSALGVGLNAEFYRAATPGEPYQVAIQRGVRMYHDQTTRPLHDMRWEMFTLLAHGAFVTMIDKTAFDGSLDPVAYQRIGKLLQEAREKREHFGQQRVYDVGLYFSSRTRDWVGREEAARYFHSFQGAHQACVMEHLQCGVILDENVTLRSLKKFPVVCLPNTAIISEREAELFRNYVREGGNLLLTGQPGQYGSRGEPLNRSVLEDLIGARAVQPLDSEDNWISVSGVSPDDSEGATNFEAAKISKLLTADLRVDWPFLVKGPATVYEPTTAAVSGTLYQPHRTRRQLQGKMGTEWPMSADRPVGPAVLLNDYGNGRVITCAGSPDYATAGEHALVEDRTLFRNLFQAFGTKRRVVIEAPSNVEAIVTDDPDERYLRIHLLGYHPTPRTTPQTNRPYVLPGLIEDPPIFRVTIVSDAADEASALNSSTVLQHSDRAIRATIEDVHEVIQLQY